MLPLVFSWFLTLGYVPEMTENVATAEAVICSEDAATLAEIGLAAEWRGFTIEGWVATYQLFEAGSTFKPFRADYKFGVRYDYRFLTIGIEHECDHPVVSLYSYDSKFQYLSSQTKIYATIRGSTR